MSAAGETEWLIVQDVLLENDKYFNSSANFDAGDYRITYVRGAFIYIADYFGSPGWATGIGGLYAFWNDGATTQNISQNAGYVDQPSAEAPWLASPPTINFTHTSGKIGMHFEDVNYLDNVDGSPNPTWRLQKL
jgi:hypothetical protein